MAAQIVTGRGFRDGDGSSTAPTPIRPRAGNGAK